MASKRHSAPTTVKSAAFALAPQPLGQADFLHAQSVLAAIAPDWSVELVGICDEEASLVILPEDGDDTQGPSFAISRETCGLRLDKIHWDELSEVGVFACLDDVMDAVAGLLYGLQGLSVPSAATVH